VTLSVNPLADTVFEGVNGFLLTAFCGPPAATSRAAPTLPSLPDRWWL
jgi:hypothetical protein